MKRFALALALALSWCAAASPQAPTPTPVPAPAPTGATASLRLQDTTTQGSWIGAYGSQGYLVAGSRSSPPAYATVTLPAGVPAFTWTSATADARALLVPPAGPGRIAGCWYNAAGFSVDVNITDGQAHAVSLYFLDWDSTGRAVTVTVSDAATGAVLDTQAVSGFHGGTYCIANVSGHVVIKIGYVGGVNVTLSGIFFDGPSVAPLPPPPPPPPPPVVVSPWVVKSGTLLVFGAAQGSTPAPINAAPSASPTVYRNGKAVTLGAPVGTFGSVKDLPLVAYRLNCGSVRTIAVANGGSGYTAGVAVKWNGDGGGSSLVLGPPELTAAGAIRWVPIVSSSADFTAPPTFTVVYPHYSGTGAALSPIMSGVQPGDAITYDAPANWISPAVGGAEGGGAWSGGKVQPIKAVAGGAVDNWAGRLEGASGPFACFAQTPKLIPGANVGAQPSTAESLAVTAKNRAKVGFWQINGGTLTTDAGGTPVSWTNPAGATVSQWLHGPLGTGPLGDPWPAIPGRWTLRYDDPGAGTPMAATVTLGSRYGATLASSAIDGRTVTKLYDIEYPANATSWELDVAASVRAPAGPDGLGHWTISRLKVVPPDARDGSAQPIAEHESDFEPDPNALRALAGVGVTRWMDATAGFGGSPSAVLPGDLRDPHAGSWQGGRSWGCRFVAARFYNTDPASTTYAWSSPTIAGPQALFGAAGITIPPGDNGAWLAGGDGLVMELRSAAPHPFRTGDWIGFGDPSPVGVPIAGTTASFAPTNSGSMAFVTSPTTVVVSGYNPANRTADGQPQRVGSTAEIDLTAGGTRPGWNSWANQAAGNVPFRYAAAFAGRMPGSRLWVNLPVMGTDAVHAAIAGEIAREIGPSNKLLLEYGNELWNGGGPQASQIGAVARVLGVVPKGTTVLERCTSTGAAPVPYGAYVAMAGHAYKVFADAAQTAGIDPSRVETVYGSFWVGYWATQQIVAAANATGWRVDHVAVAPYLDTPGDPSIVAAFSPAGSSAAAQGWPCDAINDFVRHWGAYSAVQQSYWRGHARALAGSTQANKPDIVCYEGGFEVLIPAGVPRQKALWVDCLAHPSARDLTYGWFAICQQGDPQTPNSGASLACFYQAFSPQPMWSLASGVGHVAGSGAANKYATYQGGYPADGHEHAGGPGANVSPLLQGLQDWGAAVANPTPVPVPAPTQPAVLTPTSSTARVPLRKAA